MNRTVCIIFIRVAITDIVRPSLFPSTRRLCRRAPLEWRGASWLLLEPRRASVSILAGTKQRRLAESPQRNRLLVAPVQHRRLQLASGRADAYATLFARP